MKASRSLGVWFAGNPQVWAQCGRQCIRPPAAGGADPRTGGGLAAGRKEPDGGMGQGGRGRASGPEGPAAVRGAARDRGRRRRRRRAGGGVVALRLPPRRAVLPAAVGPPGLGLGGQRPAGERHRPPGGRLLPGRAAGAAAPAGAGLRWHGGADRAHGPGARRGTLRAVVRRAVHRALRRAVRVRPSAQHDTVRHPRVDRHPAAGPSHPPHGQRAPVVAGGRPGRGRAAGQEHGVLPAARARRGIARHAAAAIWAPSLAWQADHGWAMFEMSRNLRREHSGLVVGITFFPLQLLLMNPVTAPVWLSGLVRLWRDPERRPYRAIAIAFAVVALTIAVVIGDRPYFTAPMYTALFAAGAVVFERRLNQGRARWSRRAAVGVLVAGGARAAAAAVPGAAPSVLPSGPLGAG